MDSGYQQSYVGTKDVNNLDHSQSHWSDKTYAAIFPTYTVE